MILISISNGDKAYSVNLHERENGTFGVDDNFHLSMKSLSDPTYGFSNDNCQFLWDNEEGGHIPCMSDGGYRGNQNIDEIMKMVVERAKRMEIL